MDKNTITVTSPLLPSLDDFTSELKKISESKWITNNGSYHKQLETALAEYLKVPYVSLFTNGTLPLMTALQALRITGEVITTPYSFVATTHSIWWNGCKPVFVDIDPATGDMDPNKIEAAITPRTTAIMPVHVYGKPCDTKAIQDIADKYGLKVIYDAAHAFGVEVPADEYGLEAYDDKGLAGILNAGDMSTLSFHATKVYNTIEGITFFDDVPGVKHNFSYFPIFVDAEKYGMTRDELYFKMKSQNVLGRRYFYPLISEFSTYRGLESAAPENLPNAHKMADSVICLPMHHLLSEEDIQRVLDCILK